MNDNLLSLNNITKYYNNNRILNNITLSIKKGSITGIIGSSGSGKSTLLYLMSLLEEPEYGSIVYHDLNYNCQKHLIRLNYLGFIFQNYNLLPDFSVYENIAIPGIIAQKKNYDIRYNVDFLLEKLNLTTKKKCFPTELSGGEQQRVAIARSLINNPKLVLADEPTGNLDPSTSENVLQLFINLSREMNTSVVIVTHNYTLLPKMDKKLLLHFGELKVL